LTAPVTRSHPPPVSSMSSSWRPLPSDGQERPPLTEECGNAGPQGEWRLCNTAARGALATPSPGAVTELLRAWGDGDDGALERLVEAERRRLARGYMRRERRDHTLQTTALVNEAFLRLTGARRVRWQDRGHFLGISAPLMRGV